MKNTHSSPPFITTVEINATDLDRAANFYSKLLGKNVPITTIGGEKGALITDEGATVAGVIRAVPEYARPSDQGNNVYFRVENIKELLSKVEGFGGKIIVPLMEAGDFGQFAWILDSEGNRVGLNQPVQ